MTTVLANLLICINTYKPFDIIQSQSDDLLFDDGPGTWKFEAINGCLESIPWLAIWWCSFATVCQYKVSYVVQSQSTDLLFDEARYIKTDKRSA